MARSVGVSPRKMLKSADILNLALGATGGDLDKLPLPQKYEIDYVRIYQKKDSPHKGTIPYRAEK